jgi:hypothetical protein
MAVETWIGDLCEVHPGRCRAVRLKKRPCPLAALILGRRRL